MDDELRGVFRDAASRLTPPRPALDEVVRGGRRIKWRHRVLTSVSVTTVALVAIPFIGNLTSDRNNVSPAKPNLEVAARISVGHYPTAVAFGHGAAWVINWDGVLQRIDPSTNEVVATIQIMGGGEEGAEEPAENDGSETNTLPPEPGRQFGTVTTGEGAVWVTASSRRGCNLYKVDPGQNEIAASTQVPGCYPIIAAAGSVWLGVGQDGDAQNDYLLRLHSMTLEVQDRVKVGACCMSGVAYENGFIWVGQQDVGNRVISEEADERVLRMRLAVLQVDPATNRVIGSAPLPGDLYSPGDTLLSHTMTSTADGIWLTRPETGQVDRIDAPSGRVSESVRIDDFRLPDDPQVIDGYISVTELNGRRIALLDPSSNQVVEVFDSGDEIAQWSASGADSLWVAHPESDEVLRLTLDARPAPSPSPTTQEIPCTPQSQQMKQANTKLGQWLLELLERVGGPEGWKVTRDQITEPRQFAGSGFLLQLPQYGERFDVALFAEPPDVVNVTIDDVPIIARSGEWTLHAGWIRKGFQQFIAASPELWITMHVFPLEERISRDAMIEWFHRVVEEIGEHPPPPECISSG